jgi:hypothetical protein
MSVPGNSTDRVAAGLLLDHTHLETMNRFVEGLGEFTKSRGLNPVHECSARHRAGLCAKASDLGEDSQRATVPYPGLVLEALFQNQRPEPSAVGRCRRMDNGLPFLIPPLTAVILGHSNIGENSVTM